MGLTEEQKRDILHQIEAAERDPVPGSESYMTAKAARELLAALAEAERERNKLHEWQEVASAEMELGSARVRELEEEIARMRELAAALDGLLVVYRMGQTGEQAGRAVDRVTRARNALLGGGEK